MHIYRYRYFYIYFRSFALTIIPRNYWPGIWSPFEIFSSRYKLHQNLTLKLALAARLNDLFLLWFQPLGYCLLFKYWNTAFTSCLFFFFPCVEALSSDIVIVRMNVVVQNYLLIYEVKCAWKLFLHHWLLYAMYNNCAIFCAAASDNIEITFKL